MVALLVGSWMAFGCQGRKSESHRDAPSQPAESPAAAAAEAAPDDVQAEPPGSSDSEDSAVEVNPLVAEIMGLTQVRTVSEVDGAIQIRFPLDGSPKIDADSPPKAVTDAMMFAIFYTLPQVYGRSENLDELVQVYNLFGKTIGEIRTTRASFSALGYEEALAGVTDENSKRAAQKKLLRQLPKGAVKIDKKYRP